MYNVEVGQVYESTDPRDWVASGVDGRGKGLRRLRVVTMHGGVGSPVLVTLENVRTGRRSTVRASRLRPTRGSRGYNLVEAE